MGICLNEWIFFQTFGFQLSRFRIRCLTELIGKAYQRIHMMVEHPTKSHCLSHAVAWMWMPSYHVGQCKLLSSCSIVITFSAI
jgi:hypothetical protein